MEKLSVVIITLNEGRKIAACLTAVGPIADEIIVLDGGSTDQTEEVVRSFSGIRFLTHPFDSFGLQKQRAVEAASYPLILSIDADEVITEGLLHAIGEVKSNRMADGYLIERITNFYGRWIRWYPWHPELILRLFDRRKGAWDGQPVHEKVVMSDDASIATLSGKLQHYSYDINSQKVDYARIKAMVNAGRGKNVSVFKVLFSPPVRFLKTYLVKGAWLNGATGIMLGIFSAHSSFLANFYLWVLTRKEKGEVN